MPTIKDYVATIEGICGAEKDVIVTFKSEKKDIAIANIIERSKVKKSVSGFIFELEFQSVTFRLFRSGRAVFRSIKNKKQLNKILAALLL
jgi:TATA-box binding protein (TBP) (component of TFIID and TFIIIB)